VGRLGLPVLFSVLTAAFAAIAVAAASHGMWVVAVAAGVIGAWMGNLAWAALRRMRR
jgi:succinate-acetate transporter protein